MCHGGVSYTQDMTLCSAGEKEREREREGGREGGREGEERERNLLQVPKKWRSLSASLCVLYVVTPHTCAAGVK